MSATEAPPSLKDPLIRDLLGRVARYWWVELIIGAFWVVISLVILKFNHASVTTVGILIGIMFLLASAQELLFVLLERRWWRWLWALFAGLLFAGGILAFIHPRNTFAAFADILGFVFLVIGAFWIGQAFAERPVNELWWLNPDRGHPGLLDGGRVLPRQGLHAARVRGNLGAYARRDRHHPGVSDPQVRLGLA